MSDDTTVLRRLPEGWTSTRIVGGLALAVTIAVLVVGATLIGGSSGPFEDAGGRISGFYEASDVEGMMRAFAPGSVPEDQREATESALSQILVPGVPVAEVADPIDVAGVPVVRVTTADRIEWCVTPSGAVLPRCRVGEVVADASGDDRLVADVAQVDLPLGATPQLTLGLSTTGDEPVTLTGLELVDADGQPVAAELAQVVQVRGGQGFQGDPEAPVVEPGGQLFLGWFLDGDAPSGQQLRLAWDGGALDLDFGNTRWFVR